jgi:cytosolic carboxypeptidase protein 2/3
MAIKMNDSNPDSNTQTYNLLLQNDINTKGHTQWFYFRVKNTTKGLSAKFNILNLRKPDSLYNYGMKILCYSSVKRQKERIEWHRSGRDIMYYKNAFKREGVPGDEKYFYTLTFTYDFEYDGDEIYFAYSMPYSYSDL